MQNLSKLTAKVNPMFLNNLQKVYIARAQVFHQKSLQEQNLETVFHNVNTYSDGQGHVVMSKMDELFNLHRDFPRQQYELLNTSYVDTMHITSIEAAHTLVDEISNLIGVFEQKRAESCSTQLLRVARNNGAFIDMPVSQMFSNWSEALRPFVKYFNDNAENLRRIPLGGRVSSVHPQLNKFLTDNFFVNETKVLAELNKKFPYHLESNNNRILALSQMSSMVDLSGTTANLASCLIKLANETRFLSSGPRSGFGEISLPENEPGSSIMPGKVNPTQCESLTMVSTQVIGNNSAVTIANGASMFESNNFKPLICNNVLRSLRLLADGLRSYRNNCAVGIVLNEGRIKENVNNFLH